MGTEVANKREVFVGVRFTRAEYEQLLADMSSVSCLSISKYVRIRTLNQQIRVEKFTYNDRALRKQINDLSKKVSVIGNNVNQVVKKYNTSCNAKKVNGDPVINTKATIFYFNKLMRHLNELRDYQNKIIESITKIKID